MSAKLNAGKKFKVTNLVVNILLIAWFIFSLFPIIYMLLLSLKDNTEQTSTYFSFHPTLSNFVIVLGERGTQLTSVDYPQALVSSVVTCFLAVLVSLIIGIPAAYSAARFKFKGSDSLLFTILSFRFAPELMVIVPLFVIYNQAGLYDTRLGLVWVLQLVTMPFVIWILRSYFEDLPEDLEQAALLDGYSRKRAFLKITLPLVKPGIASAALLAFIFAWNNYVFPLILAGKQNATMTVAISRYMGGGGEAYYNLTAAAACIAVLPPLIVAIVMQRYLVRGLSLGAVKN